MERAVRSVPEAVRADFWPKMVMDVRPTILLLLC
jgi:hypothetical protein